LLRALDKPFLHSKAAAVGLAPPRSVTFASQEEALAAAKDFAFPLIVKPVRSVTWTADQMNEQMALVVEDATHLKDAVVTVGAPLTLQEYVHAASIVSCAAVRAEGLLLGLTFVRYARTHPLENGDAAMATTIAAPRLLTDQVQQLLDLIGWCGIFELELLDLGEERFAAIDLNPRPFGWMSLPIGAGANLPALWCDHVLRRHSVSAQVARVGIHYRWADADIRNALTLLRRGHLRSTVAALRPHRRVVHPHFRLDDPGPAVARMGFAAEKMISQRRSILGGARIRARGSNQSAHDPQKPCKDA